MAEWHGRISAGRVADIVAYQCVKDKNAKREQKKVVVTRMLNLDNPRKSPREAVSPAQKPKSSVIMEGIGYTPCKALGRLTCQEAEVLCGHGGLGSQQEAAQLPSHIRHLQQCFAK